MIMNIYCTAVNEHEDGFRKLSEEECKSLQFFGFYEGGINRYSDPYGCKSFIADIDEHYRIAHLFNDVFKQFGIRQIKIEEIDDYDNVLRGAEIILVIGDNTFAKFTNQRKKLIDVINNYQLASLRLYIQPTSGYGEVLKGKNTGSFKFVIPSGEGRKHNEPHVHVYGKDDRSGTFSIISSQPLQAKCSLRQQEITRVKKIVNNNKEELQYEWDRQCDGIDIEQYFS